MDIQKIKNFSDSAGVYIMKSIEGNPLYIGKAKSLKKRILSHFQKPSSARISLMLSQVKNIDFILTNTEYKALLLEAQLIKKYQPKYNVDLRDDKSFPYVRISRDEFPIISIARPKDKADADYFGPYTSARLLRQALKIIRKVFAFCSCENKPKKPCLYYRIKLCPAPYSGKISRKEYLSNIKNIKLILLGKQNRLFKSLSKEMHLLAKQKKFEQAGIIRDRINTISSLLETNLIADTTHISLEKHSELEDLKKVLGLAKLPRYIEAFDISNIMGKQACGSMAAFLNGRPYKDNYRRFKIKEVSGVDDYKMLAEVIFRRYNRVIKEGLKRPDLIVIDGGKGHLYAALEQLEALKLSIPAISIAKVNEEIYSFNKDNPIRLKTDSKALQLIQRVRNEAHRFAITYHRLLRKKNMFENAKV